MVELVISFSYHRGYLVMFVLDFERRVLDLDCEVLVNVSHTSPEYSYKQHKSLNTKIHNRSLVII